MESRRAEPIKGPVGAVPRKERLWLLPGTHDRQFTASQRRDENEKAQDKTTTRQHRPQVLLLKGMGESEFLGDASLSSRCNSESCNNTDLKRDIRSKNKGIISKRESPIISKKQSTKRITALEEAVRSQEASLRKRLTIILASASSERTASKVLSQNFAFGAQVSARALSSVLWTPLIRQFSFRLGLNQKHGGWLCRVVSQLGVGLLNVPFHTQGAAA